MKCTVGATVWGTYGEERACLNLHTVSSFNTAEALDLATNGTTNGTTKGRSMNWA
jgi:hypothetical protein